MYFCNNKKKYLVKSNIILNDLINFLISYINNIFTIYINTLNI